MKYGVLATLVFMVVTLQTVSTGQGKSETKGKAAPAKVTTPSANARIVSHEVMSGGALRIVFSDGAIVEIPKERGRFDRGEGSLTQESFDRVQVDADRQRIGWLASYMMCAQSYPCAMDLVIFRAGQKSLHISPEIGIPWEWSFIGDGKEVVLHSGFPHGDGDGYYTLWNTESGLQRSRYVPGEGKAPKWVQQMQPQKTAPQ